MDIPGMRLWNQHLTGEKFDKASDAVAWLGAVQAQDFAAAKWALGMRMQNATDVDVEKAFNEGSILRTHVMRPTWHFVMPTDIRWMQELTAAQVKKLLAHYNRKLELDDVLFKKSNAAITKALNNHTHLTRQKLKKILEGIGIKTNVQRLAHIVIWAELDALICSGPRHGKQFTYALLEERVRKTNILTRDEALAKLALKYFTSHGPAQVQDFAWWSGLSMKDAFAGLDAVKPKMVQETLGGKNYWFSPNTKILKQNSLTAFLLSIYDEYTIAYKDRSALGGERYIEKMISMGNALTSVLIIDGKIVGTWKRSIKKDKVNVQINPFRKLDKAEKQAIESAALRYGKFLNASVFLI